MMSVLDLFSGIGGFSLGLESTGYFETVAFCEIEPFPRRVLAKRWPGVPIHEDIRKLRGDDIGPVDLICGGPPCQPASRAGKQAGADDDRWLWGEAIRLVRELRPRWICFENPPGIYDVGLSDILADLESLGYANAADRGRPYIAPLEIPACALGAFTIRNRVWILAYADNVGLEERPVVGGNHGEEREAAAGVGLLGYAPGPRLEGAAWERMPGEGRPRIKLAGADGYAEPVWIQCHDGKYRAVEPTIPLLANAVPERVSKIAALGNAVDPVIVAAIGRAIAEAER